MRLAFTTRAKRGDTWEDVSNYCDVVLFGREGLGPYLLKGAKLGITGRLQYREWESDAGKRSVLEVVANEVQLLDAKKETRADDSDHPF